MKRVGETTFELVRRFVDEIVAVPDEWIFENVLWTMAHTKLVVEGAAAATVAALRGGQVEAPPGTKVVCVLSGGNLDLRLHLGTPTGRTTEAERRLLGSWNDTAHACSGDRCVHEILEDQASRSPEAPAL